MEPKVPSGLLTISQSPSELGKEKLNVTIIRGLWQAFFVSRQASNNQTDRRLEYLFWRIWSSDTLQSDASIESLDRLVSRIMESSNEMPKTPVKIPPSPELTQPSQHLPSAPRAIPHTSSKSQPAIQSKSPLPPILKKPNSVHEAPKSARLLLKNPDGESVTLNPSTPPNPNMVELNTKDNGSGRKIPKKPHVNANRTGRSSRRRPVFNRRKSSQTSIRKATSPPSEQLENSHSAALDSLYNADFTSPSELSQPEIQGMMSPEPEDSWADIESVEGPVPIRRQASKPVTSPAASFLAGRVHPLRNPEISPAVLEIADKQDPILPQGIQTVSGSPIPKEGTQQHAEPMDFSFSDAFPSTPDEIAQDTGPFQDTGAAQDASMAGLTDAKRIPMPKSMLRDLLTIIEDPKPLTERISLPIRPWFTAEHAWCRLPEQNYLLDWMILDDPRSLSPQPSRKRLVERGFRKNFADQVEEFSAYEKRMRDGLGLLDCGTPQREIWNDNWESDAPTLMVELMESPQSEHGESE
ncbi:uncharacterized protein N7498_010298 [Penicillium cinerascens]|uniref:Nitrogen regulatory protein areA GATA-like domain-containing protein n=1 Tax=Penicillium cinerascens TaxID=70096 RepID=A0A9W9J766_9EURO|nr:uncharacterized protein N7498_010298 [Penicillium cinerascens]KAJ5191313.1 hypothetical protein N7498_010298 [Penicillium cinerascens]